MLVFKVVGTKKTFKIPQEWGEIKLQDYALFIDTITTLQNKLKEDEKEDCGLYELILSYRSLFNDIFEAFTGADSAIIEKIKAEDMYTVYNYMMSFLEEPDNIEIKSFKFKNKTYYLPKSKIDYFGNEMKMAEATFGEVVEAMQVQELDKTFADNNYKALPYQIAILCRPKGEAYDDQKVSARAELFQELPMNIVWSIAFFLMRRRLKSLKATLQSLKAAKETSSMSTD